MWWNRVLIYNMKKYINILILIIITTVSCSKKSSIQWYDDFSEALKVSQSENKPIMIYFYTEWCTICKVLDRKIYADKNIVKKLDNFISVKLNPEDNKTNEEITKEYNVDGFPTIVFINNNEFILKRVVGYLEPDNFSDTLDLVLAKVDIVKEEFKSEEATTKKLDIYIDSQYVDKSIEMYDTLLENNKIDNNNIPKYLSSIATIMFENNRIEESLEYFDKILNEYSSSPEVYNAHFYKAIYMYGNGEINKTIEYLENLKDKAPSDIKEKYIDFINYIKEEDNI